MVSKLNPTKFSISLRKNATFSAPLTSDTIPFGTSFSNHAK
jgi:hypothetical protein